MNKFNLKKRTYRRVLIMSLLLYAYSYSDSFAQSCNDDISVSIASRVEGTILNSGYSTWTLNAKLEIDSVNNISYQWSIADKVISNNYSIDISKKGVYSMKVSYDINGIKQSVLCSLKVEWINTNSVTINGYKYTVKENTKSQTKDIINREKIPLPDENQRPIAKDDMVKVKFNKLTAIDIESNDSDPDGDTLDYSIVKSPQNGHISKKSKHTNWTYKNHKTVKTKTDKFVYKACDTEELCDCATVIINIDEPKADRIYLSAITGFGTSNFDMESVTFDYGTNRGVTENAITNKGRSSVFGVEIDYFFSDYIGISTGARYNRTKGQLNISNFKARYQSDYYNYGNNPDWDYERIVSIDNLTEKYTITDIAIPLSLKFKATLKDKIGVFANVGILYNISPSVANNFAGGAIDYEAIYYSVDGVNYGYDNTGANTFDTDQLIRSNNNHLESDLSLNLGRDIEAASSDDDKITLDSHISLLGRIGLTYALSDKMSVLIAGQYTSGRLSSASTDGYRIADKINSNGQGEYNSPLKGGAGYSTFGLNIGVSIGF